MDIRLSASVRCVALQIVVQYQYSVFADCRATGYTLAIWMRNHARISAQLRPALTCQRGAVSYIYI